MPGIVSFKERTCDMTDIETKIRQVLEAHGIACRSVYRLPDVDDEQRILLAFDSRGNEKLSTQELLPALEEIDSDSVRISHDFQRLSSKFLHLKVVFTNRGEDHAN